jgi:hypothetical protein
MRPLLIIVDAFAAVRPQLSRSRRIIDAISFLRHQ